MLLNILFSEQLLQLIFQPLYEAYTNLKTYEHERSQLH